MHVGVSVDCNAGLHLPRFLTEVTFSLFTSPGRANICAHNHEHSRTQQNMVDSA